MFCNIGVRYPIQFFGEKLSRSKLAIEANINRNKLVRIYFLEMRIRVSPHNGFQFIICHFHSCGQRNVRFSFVHVMSLSCAGDGTRTHDLFRDREAL